MRALPKLMVAPNGARKTKADHPALPMTLDEVVATAVECHVAGADGLHLHLRDKQGGHILDAGLYREALGALRQAVPDMALQITSEAVGIYGPAVQRQVVEDAKPQAASVSLAEMLADDDKRAAVAFYDRCVQAEIAVQHILYGPHDLLAMSDLLGDGSLDRETLQMIFVLGRYTQGQQSTPADLDPFLEWMEQTCPAAQWAVCAFGKQETACLGAALARGGHVRVGFENSFWNADGSMAASNAERVREIKTLSDTLKSQSENTNTV
ncbi:3-keto-5-aminohexanoate cleavage protein [Sulfitobacter geojensis]|uniref:3-keto-5-aminohexanoate cleavage protein n=1 Tax=Sulfitobacter geojensis TaxID=1342299 RepID=UPI002490DB32|nr:3-keto-5-aminohexanoate cleavage protein [Sulfitobacter geojensis]